MATRFSYVRKSTTPPRLSESLVQRIVRALRKDANHDGAMIALYLPTDLASAIALPGGEPPADLHLTLVYLGEDADQLNPQDLEALTEAIGNYASELAPMAGVVSGVGRFNGGDDGPVIYATVDVPGLAAFRQNIAELAEAAGFPGSPDHDWTPHVTLAYGDAELPAIDTAPVEFDGVGVAVGGERADYPFANGPSGEGDADPLEPASLRRRRAKVRRGEADPTLAADSRLALERMVETRGEAIGEAFALDVVKSADHDVEVEVAPVDWTPDMAAVVWETKADGVSRMYVDDGERVQTLDAYVMRREPRLIELDPHAMAIERSLAALRSRGLTRSGRIDRRFTGDLHRSTSRIERTEQRVTIIKADAARRYTLGVAYPARRVGARKDTQDIDSHADYMTADELEAAAWRFMAAGAKDSGIQHREGTDGAGKVVESYIYRGPTWKVDDQMVEAGDWLLGVIWDEETWGKIEAGELTGYSMQGYAAREDA